jgi:hypothetical protein
MTTPITIAHYVDETGNIVDDRQVSGFTMRHTTFDKATQTMKDLVNTFNSGRAPEAWNGDRSKFAKVAMKKGYGLKVQVGVFQ